MSLEQQINDGRGAARLLTDDIFARALAAADEAFVAQWRAAKTPEEREAAHAKQAALDEVTAQLRVIADRGVHAEATIRQGS